jgi:hypothetical protein
VKPALLNIVSIDRLQAGGEAEALMFEPGVNVLVGVPNTGKTKWLQLLDYLLGDPGNQPFEGAEEAGLADKYVSAGVDLKIGPAIFRIERRWLEPGSKTKIYVDAKGLGVSEFQDWLLEALHIPLLHFPRGNPMSGQTWPELSFRMLLRHIYRQQRFWGDLADRQPEPEQVACLLQFLGIAENLYTEDYANLIRHKMEVERLQARRDQYNETLGDVARDVISEPSLTVSLTTSGVRKAKQQMEAEIERLRSIRIAVLEKARDSALPPQDRSRISRLTERRAELISILETTRKKTDETMTRLSELRVYRENLAEEVSRMDRAADAGSVLADLKITHCPACDQAVANQADDNEHCFLCHQPVQSEPILEQLGAVRLQFERDRLAGELKETVELSDVLERESASLATEIKFREEELAKLEDELIPARTNVGGLAQAQVSEIDMALGQAGERQRQIERVLDALDLGRSLTDKIQAIEKEIAPLQERVDALSDAIDYEAAASELEDGMNDYLNAINSIRPGSWKHSPIAITLSRSKFDIRVGARRWPLALGGTDTLYFLMAYQFGLLTLSNKEERHYPGLSIIDVPGEFSGEAIEDKENFIIQPFIDLVTTADYEGSQVIITGASFKGLVNVNRITLTNVHTA